MFDEAITALRQALEEKREPVGYFSVNDYGRWEENEGTYGEPLYTAPPKQWVGLTEQDVHDAFQFTELVKQLDFDRDRQEWCENFAAHLEAKLKEKNT